MADKLFDTSILGTTQDSLDFTTGVLQSSTEYSIIGKDLEGTIVLWNEGARRLYGYEPDEVVGKANADILRTPKDVASRKPEEIREAALRDGSWEGEIEHLRKDGRRFLARVVLTPRRNTEGKQLGFLLISKYKEQQPDLILSDVHMPVMDGFDFIQTVKADVQLRTIPFVLISSTVWADKEREHGLSLGADQFILRPIETHALIAEIESCRAKRKAQAGK